MSIEQKIIEINGVEFAKTSYSVEDIKAILGVSRQLVYRLIKEGNFKAIKLENKYRIYKDSFDKWLDNE